MSDYLDRACHLTRRVAKSDVMSAPEARTRVANAFAAGNPLLTYDTPPGWGSGPSRLVVHVPDVQNPEVWLTHESPKDRGARGQVVETLRFTVDIQYPVSTLESARIEFSSMFQPSRTQTQMR